MAAGHRGQRPEVTESGHVIYLWKAYIMLSNVSMGHFFLRSKMAALEVTEKATFYPKTTSNMYKSHPMRRRRRRKYLWVYLNKMAAEFHFQNGVQNGHPEVPQMNENRRNNIILSYTGRPRPDIRKPFWRGVPRGLCPAQNFYSLP